MFGGLAGSLVGTGSENYRQENLRGRLWSEANRADRARHFSNSSISFGGEAPLAFDGKPRFNDTAARLKIGSNTTAATSFPAPPGVEPVDGKAAGQVYHYGVPANLVRESSTVGTAPHAIPPFASGAGGGPVKGTQLQELSHSDFLGGKGYYVGPEYGTFAMRRPVHTLEPEIKTRLGAGDFTHPPGPNNPSVGMGQLEREYKSVSQALKPPGAAPESLVSDVEKTRRFDSYQTMQKERTKHSRSAAGPREGFTRPLTSSQMIGWTSAGAGALPDGFAQNALGPGLPRSTNTTGPGMKCHRETRVRQSLLVGARHVNGYGGQGCL